MRTRITELLGIKYPIIQAPANFVGVPRLVAAASNAGGFGILASGRLTHALPPSSSVPKDFYESFYRTVVALLYIGREEASRKLALSPMIR